MISYFVIVRYLAWKTTQFKALTKCHPATLFLLKKQKTNYETRTVIKSTPLEISNGVPQGSILGPILFTMAINDLSVIQSAFSYTDDTVIFSVGDTVEDSI